MFDGEVADAVAVIRPGRRPFTRSVLDEIARTSLCIEIRTTAEVSV